MSASLGFIFARRAGLRVAASRSPVFVRRLATHVGPWPGPNPLKDIFIGLSIGLAFAIVFKGWQIRDKAERVRFYQEYDRAHRVEEALAAKREREKPKEEEEVEEADTEEEAHQEDEVEEGAEAA